MMKLEWMETNDLPVWEAGIWSTTIDLQHAGLNLLHQRQQHPQLRCVELLTDVGCSRART